MADVKTLTVHGTTYNIKDANARENLTTLTGSVSTLNQTVINNKNTADGNYEELKESYTNLSSNVTDIEADVSELKETTGTLTTQVGQHTTQLSQMSPIVTHLNQLNDKINGYFNDNTARLWAGTSDRELATSNPQLVVHYTVVGRIVFFNVYADVKINENGEQAQINCPSMLTTFPALDTDMPIIVGSGNLTDDIAAPRPIYGIISGTKIKIMHRNNTPSNWTLNETAGTLRLSGFYISSKHND